MPSIQIRTVVQSDLSQLMGLDHSAKTEFVWQLELHREAREALVVATFREVRLPRPVDLNYPNNPYSLPDEWIHKAVMFAATSGPDIIGYGALTERPSSVAWLTDLVVAPRWRRQGVGSSLLASAHEWGKERGHRRLFFEMQSKNHPAIRFAQKHGFEFCGYNDHYYLTQDIALFFARAL
jgi:GNAT superfamily N-acetyltransferase